MSNWDPSKHPRNPKGTTAGGQFATKEMVAFRQAQAKADKISYKINFAHGEQRAKLRKDWAKADAKAMSLLPSALSRGAR